MVVTTMPSIASLVSRLTVDFPQFCFTQGEDFHWSAENATIYYPAHSDDAASLLHELAHGILDHTDYSRDVQLLEMERDAWQYVQSVLSSKYTIPIDEDYAEDSLDTYRDWLHARSTCPHCQATGIQIEKTKYRCMACGTKWRVNDGRICALRRYRVQ